MFGLFKAKPPLSPWELAWVESRMEVFTGLFGEAVLRERVERLPASAELPSVREPSDVQTLVDFLATQMGWDGGPIQVRAFGDTVAPDDVATLDGRPTISVRETQLADPDGLVAVLAWQLAELRLADRLNDTVKPADRAWMTDLLPVFFGLGVFAANTPLREPSREPHDFAWWGKRQRGYLPSRMFGYGLAWRAVRGQREVGQLGSHLRPDAQTAFQDSLKYLQKTMDPQSARAAAIQSMDGAITALASGSPSQAILAMWWLAQHGQAETEPTNRQLGELLLDRLRDREAEVRASAAAVLPRFNRSSDAAQDLADALRDASDEVRIAAAGALSAYVGVDDETLVQDLQDSLKDGERLVVFNVARSLTQFGAAAQTALKAMLARMRQALVECRDGDALLLLASIQAIADEDGRALVDDFFAGDAEFESALEGLWEQLESSAASP